MVKKCMWNECKHPKFLKFLELCQVFGGHPKLLLTIFYSQGEGGGGGGEGEGGGGGRGEGGGGGGGGGEGGEDWSEKG